MRIKARFRRAAGARRAGQAKDRGAATSRSAPAPPRSAVAIAAAAPDQASNRAGAATPPKPDDAGPFEDPRNVAERSRPAGRPAAAVATVAEIDGAGQCRRRRAMNAHQRCGDTSPARAGRLPAGLLVECEQRRSGGYAPTSARSACSVRRTGRRSSCGRSLLAVGAASSGTMQPSIESRISLDEPRRQRGTLDEVDGDGVGMARASRRFAASPFDSCSAPLRRAPASPSRA